MWVRLPTQIQWQNSNWRSNETGKKSATLRTPDGTNIERWPPPASIAGTVERNRIVGQGRCHCHVWNPGSDGREAGDIGHPDRVRDARPLSRGVRWADSTLRSTLSNGEQLPLN
jgi:hypothetical protein